MSKIILLAIPIVAGIVTGAFLASLYSEKDLNSSLTAAQLLNNGSPILGDIDAPITIVEWGDYQCTFCYKFHQSTLDIIKEDFIDTGKVRLVFRDYPLNGSDSLLAAEATHCANDQGKYWQYHDELYKNWGGERTGWITIESLNGFAKTVDLNLDEFNACLDDRTYQDMVIAQYEHGRRIGIDATPSFLVFDEQKTIKIRGNQPLETFLRTFDTMEQ